MTGARPALCGLALLALASCSQSEDEVRQMLSAWLTLGETRHYSANLNCTTGVFALRTERISDALPVARSTPEASSLAQLGRPFVLELGDLSVSEISARLQDTDFSLGARITNAGVGARDCLPDAFQEDYVAALRRGGEAMIFDPETDSITVIDSGLGRAWYARGATQ